MTKEGVFIPRRDTSLKLNAFVGGKIFPGKHYLAKFNVEETDTKFHLDFTSSDNTTIYIDAERAERLDEASIFETIENLSDFFESGSVGYSPNGKDFDGLKLETYNWEVKPLKALKIKSSFFEDTNLFPEGTIEFDNAVLMENIEHTWKPLKTISHCY